MGRRNEWRKRQILLPIEDPNVVSHLYNWHGGQGSSVYSLASTGDGDLVSLSMIDAALDELLSDYRRMKPSKEKRDLGKLLGDLSSVRLFYREHSAEEAGMLADQDPETFYHYDRRDYGMDAAEEEDMIKKGTWANPRKAMQPIRKRRAKRLAR